MLNLGKISKWQKSHQNSPRKFKQNLKIKAQTQRDYKKIRNKTTPKHPNSKNKIKTENKTPKIRTKYTKKSTQSQRT